MSHTLRMRAHITIHWHGETQTSSRHNVLHGPVAPLPHTLQY